MQSFIKLSLFLYSPPPPTQGNFIQCTHVPCVRKMQVSQRKPTFYRAPHTLWFVKGPCHGSRGWGRARDREQEVPRRPESQGHCGGGGGHTPRGPRSWGQWQGLRTPPPQLHANGAGAAAALQAPRARPVTRLVAGVWRCSAASECLPRKLPAPRAPGRGRG